MGVPDNLRPSKLNVSSPQPVTPSRFVLGSPSDRDRTGTA